MKSSSQGDWENIISFSASATELPRKLRPLEWEIDGFDSTSLCSSGFAIVGGGSSSSGPGKDLGHSFSRSSKSTSISSSSTEVKTYNLTSEVADGLAEDLCSSEEFSKGIGTSPSLEASFGFGEPALGLKLGKRTYFEDVCAGNNAKASTLPVSLASYVSPEKRSKSISQSLQAPRCQVEGCNLDLSSAKDYHRKHRVCERHSKCPKVIVGGLERRFCQQCSRFHGLSEFDEKKRSCRRRLSDHNARRRKPQPEPMQLNLYDGKQQMNLLWNRFSLIHTKREWEEGMPSSKPIQPSGLTSKPDNRECSDGRLLFESNKLLSSTAAQQGGSEFLSPKTRISTPEFLSKDVVEEVTFSSHMGGTQDLHRALSLLSNATSSSWDSFEPTRQVSRPTSNLGMAMHHSATMAHPFTLSSSSDYWQMDQTTVEPAAASHRDSGNQFQLFRGGQHYNENYFCSNQLS